MIKFLKLICLTSFALLAMTAYADQPSSTPLDPAYPSSVRGNAEEIATLRALIADAKAKGVTPDPAWISRLEAIELPLRPLPEPEPRENLSVEPAPSLIENPYSPLEQQIRDLEAQLYTTSASAADQPVITEYLKDQLGALYAQRPENQRSGNPLDQGNDACPATVIPGVPYFDNGTTSARANNYTPNPACNTSNAPDVIYEFTPTWSGPYNISLCGSAYDCLLYVLTGGACPGSNQIACNDDYCGLQSFLSVDLLAGSTYYIVVDGYSTNSGAYTLRVNYGCDLVCTGAAVVECPEVPDTSFSANDCDGGCNNDDAGGVNTFETIIPGQTVCGKLFTYVGHNDGPYRDTDWYQFSLAQQCTVRWSALSEYAVQLILLAAPCGGASFDLQTGAPCTPVTAQAVLPAGNYYAWIGTTFFDPPTPIKDYVATLTASPSGCVVDGFINAPGLFTGNTCGAGNDCALGTSADQTIQVLIPTNGTYRFSICDPDAGDNWDSYMYLTSTCCGTVVAQDDDGCPEFGIGLSLLPNVCLGAGLYYVTIEGFSSSYCGPYTLRVNELTGSCCYGDTTNPLCQDGVDKCLCEFVGGTWHEGETCETTDCGPRRECQYDAGYGQLPWTVAEGLGGWYSDEDTPFIFYDNYAVSSPIGTVRFWGHGSASGTPCNEQPQAVQISFHPDSAGWPQLANPTCVYSLNLLGTYIGTYNGSYDVFEFNAVLPTPCNLGTGWISIRGKLGTPACDFGWVGSPYGMTPGCAYTSNGSLSTHGANMSFCLGRQAPCPDPVNPASRVTCNTVIVGGARHIQLTWAAPNNGVYEIWSTTNPNHDGDPDGGLDPQWQREARVVVNESYGDQIWTDPATVASLPLYKNYVVIQTCRPPSNDCFEAIPVYNGLTYYSNLGASTDGPSNCGGLGSDVWFRYTATCTGNAVVNTCDHAYDTAINVFSGNCGSLVSLGCNDDFCNGLGSQVTFAATAGVTYLIQVGGFVGNQGNAVLAISCP